MIMLTGAATMLPKAAAFVGGRVLGRREAVKAWKIDILSLNDHHLSVEESSV